MRLGMDGLAALVQSTLGRDPVLWPHLSFRGRRGGLIRFLWWSGDGMSLYALRVVLSKLADWVIRSLRRQYKCSVVCCTACLPARYGQRCSSYPGNWPSFHH
ncbi:IS66 family insertion sequence element accessory protein TnpB [Paraburkholderia silvatlantica]